MLRKVISKLLLLGTVVLFCKTSVLAATTYEVPSNSNFKSYMDYTTITCKASKQYKLQQLSLTNENGLRTFDGRYCVALGNGFNVNVGDYVNVELPNGVIECVVGDIKQNIHTGDDNMQVVHNGNVVEFIVETSELPKGVARSGNIENIAGFEGDVLSITVLDSERSYPDNTVVNKFSIDLGVEVCYIIEYKFENTTRTAVVSKEVYDSLSPFETLYVTE